MNPKKNIKTSGFLRALLSLIFITLAALSCTNRKESTVHKNLIPEKKFISILTDVYIANGLLPLPEVKHLFSKKDSVLNYIEIIESYGYSYEDMDLTMNYYFIVKPKKLIRIYDQVIRKLSEMESSIQNEIMRREEVQAKKLPDNSVFELPYTGLTQNPEYRRVLNAPGIFSMTFSVTIYPDDQTLNPCFTAWYSNADSTMPEIRTWLDSIPYVKTGHPILYSINGRIEGPKPVILKAILYDYVNNIPEWNTHARIEIISFNFRADPL